MNGGEVLEEQEKTLELEEKKNDNMIFGVRLNQRDTDGISVVTSYESKFQPNGDLKNFSLDKILKNKQKNIYQIYELMSYYVEADPIFGSAIKNVLTPFSVSGWYLQGGSEEVKREYEEYFDEIELDDLLYGLFYDLYLYGNVFLYDREDGFIEILPPHRIEIMDIKRNNEPILAYKVPELEKRRGSVTEKFLKTLEIKYKKGYPLEILEGIKRKEKTIQLDPEKAYAIQSPKSLWEKYAMPMGTSILKTFSKKNLISEAENASMNFRMKSFLHVKVGDEKIRSKPNEDELINMGLVFKDAINGFPLAVTAWNVDADWVRIQDEFLTKEKRYNDVNSEILAACGLASIVVTGDSDGTSFAAAQINTSMAEKRIEQNQKKIVNFLHKIMYKRAEEWGISEENIPKFMFQKVSLRDNKDAMNEIQSLFKLGLVGYQTSLETLGYDFEQEKQRKALENEEDAQSIFTIPPSFDTQSGKDDPNKNGRPEKDDSDRASDKNKSLTGKSPKPSTE